MRAVALVAAAYGVGKGFLFVRADLQAANRAAWVNAVRGGVVPRDQPDRGVGGAGAARVDDVVAVLGRQQVEARGQAGDLSGLIEASP